MTYKVIKVGILGAGQLGRMLAESASALGMEAVCFSDFSNTSALEDFVSRMDVITYEFENIPHDVLENPALQTSRPSPALIALTSDRLHEKEKLKALGLNVAPFAAIDNLKALEEWSLFPCILKRRRLGYDGKGQVRLESFPTSGAQKQGAAELLSQPCVVEGVVPFAFELSIIVARGQNGATACYDAVQTIHEHGILRETFTPADLPASLQTKPQDIALHIVTSLNYVGVMGVEMFYCTPEQILINELAPRVHNSGHWTQDGCLISQFEQHIRAVTGLPLGSPKRHANVRMVNLLGSDVEALEDYWCDPNCSIHLYGKTPVRELRKMGHVNILEPLA